MATRNLARSAVEGGRRGRDMEKWDTRAERQATRLHLHRVDAAAAEELGPAPLRKESWWGENLTDKLKPAERYLQANAGRPWNDVWSELCRRYDRRNLKGWHLRRHIERHMVYGCEGHHAWPWASYTDGARVDDDGILRYRQRRPYGRG